MAWNHTCPTGSRRGCSRAVSQARGTISRFPQVLAKVDFMDPVLKGAACPPVSLRLSGMSLCVTDPPLGWGLFQLLRDGGAALNHKQCCGQRGAPEVWGCWKSLSNGGSPFSSSAHLCLFLLPPLLLAHIMNPKLPQVFRMQSSRKFNVSSSPTGVQYRARSCNNTLNTRSKAAGWEG